MMERAPVVQTPDGVLIVDPVTGEALAPADASLEQIAGWRRSVMDFEGALRDLKTQVDAEVIGRMDAAARWTLEAGGFKLSAPSPQPAVEYDAEALREALYELEGLDDEAIDRAVERVISFKVHAAGVSALRRLGRRDVSDAIAAHSREVPRERRVTVKEVRP